MNITIQQSEISSDGRFIVLKAAINNEIYTIANICGPNKDADAVKFYRNLSKLLRNDEFGNEETIIIGGDFNCPLDSTLDKKGGIDDYNIFPIFYKEMLHWWSDFRSRFDLVSPRETIIWNNHNIRVNGKYFIIIIIAQTLFF